MDAKDLGKKMRAGRLSAAAKQALFEARIGIINDPDRSYYQRIPKAYRLLLIKNYNNRASKSNAIKGKCLDCRNFNRNEIIDCKVRYCSLWNFRPYVKK
jgi:hypothetical protein